MNPRSIRVSHRDRDKLEILFIKQLCDYLIIRAYNLKIKLSKS